MPSVYKTLGQSNPAATTLTDLYTVPASTQTIVSTIVVANRSVATAYRISIAINGAADSNEQYIAYDVAIGANEMHTLTLGIALGDTDKIRVYATLATLSFNAFGVELT
jgi:hypothetical protein